ncbi:hypothetical protein BC829DRAFT_489209 [Chytridium lagenaria]|nr:hypothetical protein BC829DRAFT_489209 [Chytridium lagenaria]
MREKGTAHEPLFLYKVTVDAIDYVGESWKPNAKAAKAEAARVALAALETPLSKALTSSGIQSTVQPPPSNVDSVRLGVEYFNDVALLNDFCQKHWKLPPIYELVLREGPPHMPKFKYRATCDGITVEGGFGPSVQAAKNEAAKAVLKALSDTVAIRKRSLAEAFHEGGQQPSGIQFRAHMVPDSVGAVSLPSSAQEVKKEDAAV